MTRKAANIRIRHARRRALAVLALLLTASGILRLGATAGHALDSATAAAGPPAAQICETEDSVRAMLAALTERDRSLSEREARIAVRDKAVALAAEEAEKRVAALEAAEAKLAATIAIADQAAAKDVERLVAVYERMKPKDAAAVFAEMEPKFAAGFLAQMRPEAAAAVMAGLEPAAAYAISVHFAGRNAAAPKS